MKEVPERRRAPRLSWILRSFPRSHRERYGSEMVETYALLEEELAESPSLMRWRRRLRCLANLLWSGFRIRVSGWKSRIEGGRFRTPDFDPKKGGSSVEQWLRDVRYGLRQVARQPFLSGIIALVLALGIGANMAIFNFIETLLWKPLPVPRPEQVVTLNLVTSESSSSTFSYPFYRDLRERAQVFQELAAHRQVSSTLGEGAEAVPIEVELVSGNYFRMMQISPLQGRLLEPSDDEVEGDRPVAVISERLWRTHLQERPDILGQFLYFNGTPLEVVGIVPGEFRGAHPPLPADVWVPIAMQDAIRSLGASREDRGWGWLQGSGRLREGVSLEQARADLARVSAQLSAEYPRYFEDRRFSVSPATYMPSRTQSLVSDILWLMAGISGLILVATCTNVAGVVLSRSLRREREYALRRSLGATRWALVRQTLTESLILSLVGGFAALFISRWVQSGFVGLVNQVDRNAGFRPVLSLDLPTLAFAFLLSLLACAVVGLMPALKNLRAPLLGLLRQPAGSRQASSGSSRAFGLFLVAQVAICLILLVASGLLVRTLQKGNAFDLGFDSQNLLLVNLNLKPAHLSREAEARFLKDLTRVVAQEAPIEGAALALKVPLDGSKDRAGFRLPDANGEAASKTVPIDVNTVTPGYFELMGIPVLAGREFDPRDDSPGAESVVLVNQAFVSRASGFWKDREPLGKLLQTSEGTRFSIVGVVANVNYYSLGEPPEPMVFLPPGSVMGWPRVLHLRTWGEPAGLGSLVRRRVAKLEPRVQIDNLLSFEELRRIPLLPQRALALVSSIFGGLALLLTLIGLYALVSSAVTRRTQEIGIRLALGAHPRKILCGVLGRVMILVAGGILSGLVLAGALSSFLTNILFQVSGLDPLTYLGVAALLVLVSVAASLVPLRRINRIEPVRCLRYE